MTSRTIRVFISSTFLDMRTEREELAKFAFPELRRRCKEQFLEIIDVDLRWGIPFSDKEEQIVLSVCFDEINRCDYFVGLLADRYGWIPEEIDKIVLHNHPWLKDYSGLSITELEILYRLLGSSKNGEKSLFYFRDSSKTIINNNAQSMKRGHKQESDDERLNKLKLRILNSGHTVKKYDNNKFLGKLVVEDLWEIIRKRLSTQRVPSPREEIRMQHMAFAESRCKIYISRESYYKRLDDFVDSTSPPLAIVGPSGFGKSALVANWAKRYADKNPDIFLFSHFVASSGKSASYIQIIRRIIEEFKYRYYDKMQLNKDEHILAFIPGHYLLEKEIPSDSAELVRQFPIWLSMAAEREKIILIIDSLDQIKYKDRTEILQWLPKSVPPNIRIILSTSPSDTLTQITKLNWPTLKIEELSRKEIKELTNCYLGHYGKKLEIKSMAQIIESRQASNPIYLRSLLEELRIHGDYSTLEKRIEHYLKADTPEELFNRILKRFEDDFDSDWPGLVGAALSYIWASRRGLTETELYELVAKDIAMPRVYWSRFYIASSELLIDKSGIINFYHKYIQDAAEKRYLSSYKKKQATHKCLANYFSSRELDGRKLEELPWQLTKAKEWNSLTDLLLDKKILLVAFKYQKYDYLSYWNKIELATGIKAIDYFWPIIENPEKHDIYYLESVASITSEMGYMYDKRRLTFLDYLATNLKKVGEYEGAFFAQMNKAMIYRRFDDYTTAMIMLKECEREAIKLIRKDLIARAIGNQALVLKSQRDPRAAMNMHKIEEKIFRELGDKEGLAICLGNQSHLLEGLGDLTGSLELLREAEKLNREKGDLVGLADTLDNQAKNHLELGKDYEIALQLNNEAERIYRSLGNKDDLAVCLGIKAAIFIAGNKFRVALPVYKEMESISLEIDDSRLVLDALSKQGALCQALSYHDKALEIFKRQEKVLKKLDSNNEIVSCIENQAWAHYFKGEWKKSLRLFKEQEMMLGQMIEKENELRDDKSSGPIIGKTKKAVALYRDEVNKILRPMRLTRSMLDCLCIQAALLSKAKVSEGLKEARLKIRRLFDELQETEKELVLKSPFEEIEGLSSSEFPVETQLVPLLERTEQLTRAIDKQEVFASLLFLLGGLLADKRDLNGAIVVFQKCERIWHQVKTPLGEAMALFTRATAYSLSKKKKAIAVRLWKKVLEISNENNIDVLKNQTEDILKRIIQN